jgi:uncharacterized protein (DUF2236 family)
MIVTRNDLEAGIRRVTELVEQPAEGIYGPGSVAWRINKQAALLLGGGRAALLQIAHPFVAHAVDEHSQTRTDPQGRFVRTFANVYSMVFGDLDRAVKASRRVHAIHTRVTGEIPETLGAYPRGTPYAANDADSLMWVHATLLETAVRVYELVAHPLTDGDKRRYYDESRRFAHLFGIPESVQPRDWPELVDYWNDMLASDRLAVGTAASDIARFLLRAPRPAAEPIARWYRAMTAGLMPARFREPFGLRFGARERAVFRASIPVLRAAHRITPRQLQYVPAYVAARRRLAGNPPEHALGKLARRWMARSQFVVARRPAA